MLNTQKRPRPWSPDNQSSLLQVHYRKTKDRNILLNNNISKIATHYFVIQPPLPSLNLGHILDHLRIVEVIFKVSPSVVVPNRRQHDQDKEYNGHETCLGEGVVGGAIGGGEV